MITNTVPADGTREEYELPEGFTGEVQIRPGFDKRSSGFGLSMVRIEVIVIGPQATMVFDVSTGITPVLEPGKYGVSEWMHDSSIISKIEYHGDIEAWEGQESVTGWSNACTARPSGRCLSDTAYTAGEPLEELLFKRGERAVMRRLVEIYRETYERSA